MKIKATLEIEYEVDPDQYQFSEDGDKKEAILKFERMMLTGDPYYSTVQGCVTIVNIDPFKAYISRVKDGTREHFQETYLGEWDNKEDFARYVLKIKYPEIANIVNSSEVRDFWLKLFAHTYFSVKSETGIFVFTREKV